MSRSFGGTSVTSFSPMKMWPSLTSSRPASIRSEVDLPQPDGPTSTRNSPSPTWRLSASTAARVPPGYKRVAWSKVTVAMDVSPSPAGTCRTIRSDEMTEVAMSVAIGRPAQYRTGPGPGARPPSPRCRSQKCSHGSARGGDVPLLGAAVTLAGSSAGGLIFGGSMTSVTGTPRPSKNERRDAAREKARLLREQQQRRQRRNRMLLQGGIAVVVLAIVAVVALVIVNAVRPPGPGPRNMASDGITITQGDKAVRSAATPAGGTPAAPPTPATGKIVIRTYEDFGCPFCGQFEQTNSAYIASLLKAGTATLTIYPVSILDRSFSGSKYSTRSANAAAAVANYSPDQFYAFHKLLYANQPAEGSEGLTDDKLIAYAKQAKVSDLASVTAAIHDHRFFNWV